MVLDPLGQSGFPSAPRSGSGRGKSAGRGVVKRRKSGGRKFGPQAAADAETANDAAEAADGAVQTAAPVTAPAEPQPAHQYDDSKLKRIARNARLRTLAFTVPLPVGAGVFWGGFLYGLPMWASVLVASVAAMVVHRLIDSRIR